MEKKREILICRLSQSKHLDYFCSQNYTETNAKHIATQRTIEVFSNVIKGNSNPTSLCHLPSISYWAGAKGLEGLHTCTDLCTLNINHC